ncbi:MAG: hypothetical protein LBK13_06765 [Spirochaetales bacterium]|jgi:hypothetical protein|nr:hypothetical protein [Spirochaetales bacterium]
MINSWKEFFIAVEQMRQSQRAFERQKTPLRREAARSCEKAVDECIRKKNARQAREREQKQLQLFENGGTQ